MFLKNNIVLLQTSPNCIFQSYMKVNTATKKNPDLMIDICLACFSDDFALNTADLSSITNYNHWGSQGAQAPPGSLQSNMQMSSG